MHQISNKTSLEYVGVEEHKEDNYGSKDEANILNTVRKKKIEKLYKISVNLRMYKN